MRVCKEQELVSQLLRGDVALTVVASGRQRCGREWVVGPRVIREHLMYYVVGPGVVRLQSAEKELLLPPETFFWLQPGVSHKYVLADATQPAEVVFLRFFLGCRQRPLRLQVPWVQQALVPELGRRLEELLPEHLPAGEWRLFVLRCQLGALMGRVLAQPAAGGTGGFSCQQKEAVLAFLRANLGRHFSLAEAARAVGLNPDYFSRQFRKSFGVPPQTWVTRARIQRAAAQLLETDMRIKQVAAELGYDDLYFFSRQFKAVMGKSPRKYRQKGA